MAHKGKQAFRLDQGWIYWGGVGFGGVHPPLALARGGAGGVLFFMIKQKNY